MKKFKTLILLMSSAFFFFTNQNVQSQDFGADVVSSYVWRGTQFGEGPHIQPYISTGKGGFEIGLWGSFPTTAAGGGNELDAYFIISAVSIEALVIGSLFIYNGL